MLNLTSNPNPQMLEYARRRREVYGFEPDPDHPSYPFHPESKNAMLGYCTVGRFEGRSEVLRYGRLLTDDPTYPGRQHWIGQSLFDGDSERCQVRSYGMVTGRSKDGVSAVRSLGYYTDHLVRVDGKWMFGERVWKRWQGEILSRFFETVPE